MSQMDFSGVDFSGLANFDFNNLDLRDSQGRYPMDPGYDPAPAADTNGTIYSQVETEVSRVTNADGTVTITYRGSTDPNAPTYTRTTGTATTTTDPGVVTYEGSGAGRVMITTYKDGRVVRVASPVGTDGNASTGGPVAAVWSPNPDARNTIKSVLRSYGLDALSDVLWANYASGLVNINNPQALIYSIRNEPAYKERFKANDARMKAGLSELSPSEYIGLEDQYRQVIRANGLPEGFYDTPDDITKLLSGDVSPSEFQSRITNGYNAVANADPEVIRQFREIYNVSEGQLVSYFLDPVRGEPLLKQQAQAAKIAARGLESGGIQLTKGTAEELAARGITEAQAQEGFGNIGRLGELKTQLGGEAALSQEQIVGQQFGTDTQAALELEKRRRRRVGEFAGGGSFARTQGETSGSITTSIGKAQ